MQPLVIVGIERPGKIVGQRREVLAPNQIRLDFFFSSRRRHTRFDCDWSSDVCSSDLATTPATIHSAQFTWDSTAMGKRSEERRVGKECRSRWWPCHQKKKRQPARS